MDEDIILLFYYSIMKYIFQGGIQLKTIHYKADLCVVGGGLAGLCCAIAAARHGIQTVLG